jgi:hypothetical protein
MDKELTKKIHDAVDYAELNPLILKGIKTGLRKHPGNKYGGTYWENYYIIKRLNLGHRPTKEETWECSLYAVAKLLGGGDAERGKQRFLDQFKGKPLED